MTEVRTVSCTIAPAQVDCLDENTLAELLEGRLAAGPRVAIDEHLDVCADCREMVGVVARAEPPDDGGEESERPPLSRGSTVGRYVILDVVGNGGMGVVYAAYDPELDRKVALKLLRPSLSDVRRDELGARIRREAKVMARLSDPHVVPVYDVGSDDQGDTIFVAMEFVEGTTLTHWLRRHRRDWREVLAAFLDAGQGLAAAHAAGIVHRDFKPDNVLVGDDGRVRVTDFGLARAFDDETLGGWDAAALSPLSELTRTGAILGTPAYMAPEQFRGEASDARSDLYSFCVALFEALYHVRPFTGEDLGGLRAAVLEGQVNEPASQGVPARIRRILLKGLRPRPEERPPDMRALLDELSDRRGRRIRARLALVTAAALVAGGFYAASREDPYAACRGAEAKLAGIWDGGRKRAIERAFLASGSAGAADSWRTTERILDDLGRRWLAMHDQACEETRVHRRTSEEEYDLRLECLLVRLQDLRALTRRLLAADRRLVTEAAALARTLPDLATCADTVTLRSRREPDCVVGLSGGETCHWSDETIKVGALAPGWTHLVAVEIAGLPHLLAYDATSGHAALSAIAADGELTRLAQTTWPAGWTSLVFLPPRVVGYDAASGAVATVDLETWTRIENGPWQPGLTVTQAFTLNESPSLIAYDPASGNARWIAMNAGGRLEAGPERRLGPGWSHLVPYNEGDRARLVAYDVDSGHVMLREIADDAWRVIYDGGWGPGWTHWALLYSRSANVLVYRAESGLLGVDRLNPVVLDGRLARTPRMVSDQRPGYTQIVGFRMKGRPHVLAYRKQTGAYLVDRFEPWD